MKRNKLLYCYLKNANNIFSSLCITQTRSTDQSLSFNDIQFSKHDENTMICLKAVLEEKWIISVLISFAVRPHSLAVWSRTRKCTQSSLDLSSFNSLQKQSYTDSVAKFQATVWGHHSRHSLDVSASSSGASYLSSSSNRMCWAWLRNGAENCISACALGVSVLSLWVVFRTTLTWLSF